MSEFHDWEDLRAELHDGDEEALAAEAGADRGMECAPPR
jgi:hypothetical protein